MSKRMDRIVKNHSKIEKEVAEMKAVDPTREGKQFLKEFENMLKLFGKLSAMTSDLADDESKAWAHAEKMSEERDAAERSYLSEREGRRIEEAVSAEFRALVQEFLRHGEIDWNDVDAIEDLPEDDWAPQTFKIPNTLIRRAAKTLIDLGPNHAPNQVRPELYVKPDLNVKVDAVQPGIDY